MYSFFPLFPFFLNFTPPSHKLTMSQPPFPMVTAEPTFYPGPPSRPPTPDPYADSQAESAYSPARQFTKPCQRCDQKGLICAEATYSRGIQARCEVCRWAHAKCEVETGGSLDRVGRNNRPTNLKKWVYVDQSGQHIGEWPFYYVEVSPSLSDFNEDLNVCKCFSVCLQFN